ncbi:MAG: SAM-dependent methyltransferase [Pyrinomonadaceae bacterium]
MVRLLFLAPMAFAVCAVAGVALGLIDPPVAAPGLADFIEWDLPNWAPALDFWLGSTSLDLSNVLALEIGAGLGGLSLWLALHGARVVCTELNGATAEARALHAKHGVSHLVTYRALDATAIGEEGCFDLVVFKSVLGDIGRAGRRDLQERAVSEIHRALRPGGELWFAENLTGSVLHRLARRFIRRGTLWRYLSLEEIGQLLAPFGSRSYRTSGFVGVFGRDGLPRRALGALDRLVFNRVAPPRWRYVVMGVAKK